MLPSLKDGDIVFFKKYKQGESSPKIGQIVIFNHPLTKKRLIKRINIVNTNSIGVVGDNIELSEDSNKFGLVNNKNIVGTGGTIYKKKKDFLMHLKISMAD